ncbi:hypothetical protein [Sphingomonas aerolata]|jgi:hypothetical protein|uniref:hypothetical protein n=1 Tax=Sphingomonas aerolata TaxID=185951 RepID=UPI002FE0A67A
MATLPARSIGPVFAKPISDCSFPILRIGDGKTGTLAMNDWLLLAAQLVFLQCPQLGDCVEKVGIGRGQARSSKQS